MHAAPKRSRKNNAKRLNRRNDDLFREDGDKDRYIITYADLITLLLGFFIILYAMSSIDKAEYSRAVSALGNVFGTTSAGNFVQNTYTPMNMQQFGPSNGHRALKRTLQRVINENKVENSVKLIDGERGITIRILDDILFPSGSADLSPESKRVLNELGKILKELPNDIRIEGHTDNRQINTKQFPSNWHLSVARATNTAYFLMTAQKLLPDKVSIVGYSEYRPVATNDTPEGRRLNRRVDIIILNN